LNAWRGERFLDAKRRGKRANHATQEYPIPGNDAVKRRPLKIAEYMLLLFILCPVTFY
jgi:hypothetical protein